MRDLSRLVSPLDEDRPRLQWFRWRPKRHQHRD